MAKKKNQNAEMRIIKTKIKYVTINKLLECRLFLLKRNIIIHNTRNLNKAQYILIYIYNICISYFQAC